MKRRVLIVIAVVLMVTIAAVLFGGRKPYKNLKTDDISYAKVFLSPPGKTVEILEIKELVSYLKDVVIYKRDDSFSEYAGQATVFTLYMMDGSVTEIMAYNPFLVINGTGYLTKYKPCQALNGYANRLMERKNASYVMDAPPPLTVISDETAFDAMLGTYSWERKEVDGTLIGIEADGAHPLECEELLLKFEANEKKAELHFRVEPDQILKVLCWSEENWGDAEAEYETVNFSENKIELKPGGYIYEVKAKWDGDNGYGGTANYSFYVKASEE